MVHFSLGTTLVLLTCMIWTAASMKSIITCDSVDNVQHLSCETGVIGVQSALYGRKDKETCSEGIPNSQLTDTDCAQTSTAAFISKRCNGKKECEFNTNAVRTSDPCFGTFKYLETNYTCLEARHIVVCYGSLAHLSCDEGQVILLYGAHYGRHDHVTCSFGRPPVQTSNVDCSSTSAFSVIYERCNGKNSCTVMPTTSLFGDPCVGTYKYLEMAYVCEYPGVMSVVSH